MTAFVLDLWHDLRAKRMWPLALLLVVAIVATPMVLLGLGSEEPTPTPPADVAADPGAAGLANLVAPSALPVGGSSTLDQFKARDPFEPERSGGAGDGADTVGGGTTQVPDLTAPSTGGAGAALPTPSSGGSGASAALPGTPSAPDVGVSSSGSGSAATPASAPPAGTPPSGGTSSGGGGSSGGSSGGKTRETRYFTYEADLKFGKPGNVRLRRGVEEFTPLPDAERGVVLFNGVTIRDQLAVFSVFDPEQAPRVGDDILEEIYVIDTDDESDPSVNGCVVFVFVARGKRVRGGEYVVLVADIERARLR